MLPCLSVGGGVKLNYPLVPRLPGDVCRGAGALALPPVVGGCIGICIRVRVPCTCAATRTRIYTYTRALPPPRRRFQLKSTPGVGPDPVPRSLLSSSTRTVLISPPNRRTCSAMHIPPFIPRITFSTLSPTSFSATHLYCLICIALLTQLYITVLRTTIYVQLHSNGSNFVFGESISGPLQ